MFDSDAEYDEEPVNDPEIWQEYELTSTDDIMLEYLKYSWETYSSVRDALEDDYLWHFYSSDFDLNNLSASEEYERDLQIGCLIVRQTLSNAVF